GVAHRELGQTEAALGMFERILEADPDDRAAALEIAEIELDQATELLAPEEVNEEIRTQIRSLLTHASTLAPESIVGPGEAVADAERWVFEGEPGSPARARWTAIEESLRTLEETLAARDAALAVREPETDPPRLSRNRQEIQRVAGILAQLSDQRQSGVFADSLHGTGAALGAVGDGFGLGTTGTGVGGGGTSEGVIGLGNVGLIGSGMGPTNPVPQIRGGQVGVRGSLDRAVVQRVIRRHMNELRYCYQRQLANNPSLQGRVELNFTIGPTGSVTAASAQGMSGVDECMARAVRRWTFPAPNGGGVVLVRYPLHLSS
ncbi:MAG: AgmX/PglI C-terminal domain-containing protein, partial [Myxococcota bacterium]